MSQGETGILLTSVVVGRVRSPKGRCAAQGESDQLFPSCQWGRAGPPAVKVMLRASTSESAGTSHLCAAGPRFLSRVGYVPVRRSVIAGLMGLVISVSREWESLSSPALFMQGVSHPMEVTCVSPRGERLLSHAARRVPQTVSPTWRGESEGC